MLGHVNIMFLEILTWSINFTEGSFKVFLSFTNEYNFKPPDVFFHTIPFHPNGKFVLCYPSSCFELKTSPHAKTELNL